MSNAWKLGYMLVATVPVASSAATAPPITSPPAAELLQIGLASLPIKCSNASQHPRSAAGRQELLRHMDGFAKLSHTTGGLNYPLYMVTTLQDTSADGRTVPGSLRSAVEQSTAGGGGWIEFSPKLPDQGTIQLGKHLVVPPNTTIDGACSGVEVVNAPERAIFVVSGVHNVIIAGLSMRKLSTPSSTVRDCVTIANGADAVWVAYNKFSNCGDGTVDVTQPRVLEQPTRVTISNNVFEHHNKVILVATQDCVRSGAPAWCQAPELLPWSWQRGNQVTLKNNIFLDTAQRHPRVGGVSYVHSTGNVVLYRNYGAFVGGAGWLLSQGDLYASTSNTRFSRALSTSEAPEASEGAKQLGSGALRATDTLVIGSANVDQERAKMVPDPPYGATPPRRADLDVRKRVEKVAARSGPAALPY
jgi:pectate lyase